MGPIEIIFLIVIALFGAVGVVRGYRRELGVAMILMLTLLVMLVLDQQFPAARDTVLAFVAGPAKLDQAAAKTLIYTIVLVIVVFVSYQGETLTFPGTGDSVPLGLAAGLLNGYLFVGTVWFYLSEANWPYLSGIINTSQFTEFYHAMLRLLPPATMRWYYLLGLALAMVVLRVWK